MSKRKAKEETVRTDDPHGVPSPNLPKRKFKPGSLLIPAIFGGILLLLFWLKKCQ